ncbi:MAG: hypothetical protein J6W64_03395 [Bacilli bacterium]|nr:hypothetical protein [Bacilli bacterium]
MKQINMEWMQSLMNDKENTTEKRQNDLPSTDWVLNGKAFKREVKFKLLPGNSRENNIFATIAAQHWNLGPNKDQRIVCTEQTSHLKNLGIKCPVCEAKRKLLAMGFKEEDLKGEGKYGPVPLFDPTLTSNVKAVILDTDLKHDWDQAHVSILQQKGTFLTRWLVQKYMDAETPDLLEWDHSNLIRFSRTTDNGKWEREITFSQFTPQPDVIAKLKEENEALTLAEIWKAPSDEEMLKMKQIVDEMVEGFVRARQTVSGAASSIADTMPF